MRALVRSHIEEAATQEWPVMAKRIATLSVTSSHLAQALRSALAIAPDNHGQQNAQAGIVTGIEAALDARRERILLSRSQVGLVKWSCLLVQAICALFAIALVHSDNRLTAAIAMGVFATGVAASVLLIAAYDRPFVGQLAVRPEPLLQVIAPADAP